ncbi:MAG: carboxypeptidase regulatory-like domain-containing protein [Planctomycetes bacterium]|nr:carboxypeptidase regulatory-like domain-containing protein [Planctomycetota bacterium]
MRPDASAEVDARLVDLERGATEELEGSKAKERTKLAEEGSGQNFDSVPVALGLVLDAATMEPIEGAQIELVRPLHKEFSSLDLKHYLDTTPVSSSSSDAEGRFRMQAPADVPLDMTVQFKDYATAHRAFVFADDPITVLLQPGAIFEGRITRKSTGEPLEGVKLRGWDKTRTVKLTGTTDIGGNFRFEGMGAGVLTLAVTPTLCAAPNWSSVELVVGQTLRKDFILEDGVAIFGVVIDKKTGQPVAGAVIGEGWTFRRSTVSDAQGHYRLEGFGGPGVYDVHVRAAGYGKAQSIAGPVEYDLPTEDTEIDFALDPANGAIGRVTDSMGNPLKGVYCAAVASQRLKGRQHTDYESCHSDADGRFAFHSLNPQLWHQVSLRASGFGVRTYDFPSDESGIVDLGTFVLHKSGAIRGTLVNTAGDPIPGAGVTLDGTNSDVSALRKRALRSHTTSYTSERDSRTDSMGRFHFADVAGGTYEIRASLPSNRGVSAKVSLELAEGETSTDTVLVLETGAAISGRALGPDNQPLLGAHVQVWPVSSKNTQSVSGRTGANGAFRISGLEEGEYFLRLETRFLNSNNPSNPLACSAPIRTATGATQIVVYALAPDTLRIKLVNAEGQPHPKGYVRVFEPGTEIQVGQGWSDDNGQFTTAVRPDSQFDIKWIPSMRPRRSELPADPTPDILLLHAAPGQQEHVLRHP